MKKGLMASVAALLIVLAGWVTQDGCTDNTVNCHLDYFLKFTKALSDVISAVPMSPL